MMHLSERLEGFLAVVLNTDQGTHLVDFLYHEIQNSSAPMYCWRSVIMYDGLCHLNQVMIHGVICSGAQALQPHTGARAEMLPCCTVQTGCRCDVFCPLYTVILHGLTCRPLKAHLLELHQGS